MKVVQKENGGKYMEQNSLASQKDLLEAQIRECYGRVTYSHKTHEKCADILLSRNTQVKLWQLILSAITTGSLIITVLGDGKVAAIIGTLISTTLLAINSYTKDFELIEIAEKHRKSACCLWNIRESYLSLLTDFPILSVDEIIYKRDKLQEELSTIYNGSPRTNYKGYNRAKISLQENEEMTFTDEEIDLVLPPKLRKN